MLNQEELQEILSSTETDRIERTVSTDKAVKFREAICAFSNDMPGYGKPGYLLIGVQDDGSPASGFQVTDRIEIQSPGGLYGDARKENFPMVNDYRNPVLAEAMAVLGYANRFGRGVARAQRLLRENGSPEAEFTIEETHFLVQIAKHPLR